MDNTKNIDNVDSLIDQFMENVTRKIKKEDREHIPTVLKKTRQEALLSLKDLSSFLGITETEALDIEEGKIEISEAEAAAYGMACTAKAIYWYCKNNLSSSNDERKIK